MNIAILYHSETGNTRLVAREMEAAANALASVTATAMEIRKVDAAVVEAADVVLFGCPIYLGAFSWQMAQFLETSRLALSGKLGGVFATERFLGGGADAALLGLIGMLLVKGMLLYSGGTVNGQPFIHFGPVVNQVSDDWQIERARVYIRRMAEQAAGIGAHQQNV